MGQIPAQSGSTTPDLPPSRADVQNVRTFGCMGGHQASRRYKQTMEFEPYMTTYNKKRTTGALVLALVAFAMANWQLGLMFPSLARAVAALSVLVALVYITRGAPTQQDFEEHRRTKAGGLQ